MAVYHNLLFVPLAPTPARNLPGVLSAQCLRDT